MIKKAYNSFLWARNGLVAVWKEEQNFRIEIVATILVMLSAVYFKFSVEELTTCLFAILFVVCAEILNTAIEDICNKIQPDHDPVIGKIKDVMAGFVLVSCGGALVVGVLVYANHFIK